jgi:hypothetical protein
MPEATEKIPAVSYRFRVEYPGTGTVEFWATSAADAWELYKTYWGLVDPQALPTVTRVTHERADRTTG